MKIKAITYENVDHIQKVSCNIMAIPEEEEGEEWQEGIQK